MKEWTEMGGRTVTLGKVSVDPQSNHYFTWLGSHWFLVMAAAENDGADDE